MDENTQNPVGMPTPTPVNDPGMTQTPPVMDQTGVTTSPSASVTDEPGVSAPTPPPVEVPTGEPVAVPSMPASEEPEKPEAPQV